MERTHADREGHTAVPCREVGESWRRFPVRVVGAAFPMQGKAAKSEETDLACKVLSPLAFVFSGYAKG